MLTAATDSGTSVLDHVRERLLEDAVRRNVDTAGQRAGCAAHFELYRHGALSFDQLEPLGDLSLHWSAETWSEDTLANLGADYDA